MAFSGYQDFNPAFSSGLQAMIAARPGISVNSGFRSPEQQAVLWAQALEKYGSPEAARKWVAPPGKSNHGFGIAADLGFATPEDRAWAHANAGTYGLNFRMSHEPWHVELIDGKATAVGNNTGAPIPDEQLRQQQAAQEMERLNPTPNRGIRNSSQGGALYNIPAGLQSNIPADPLATGAQDVSTLSNLIMSKQPQTSKAQQIFERIKEY